jgi:hypothetical protein
MTDIPICGLRTPEGMCTEPREPTEGTEAGELFGGQTYRPRCSDHRGMPADVRPEPGAFAKQGPHYQPAALARAQMVGVVVTALLRVHERGLLVFPDGSQYEDNANRAASMIIDELAADVLSKTLGGMATGQVQG